MLVTHSGFATRTSVTQAGFAFSAGEGQAAEQPLESWTALPMAVSRVYQHEIRSQVNRWASCLPTALSGGMRVKWKLSVDWHQFCDLTRMQHGHWLSWLHQGQHLAHCPSQQSPGRNGSCPGTGRDFRAVLRCGMHNAGHQQSAWERARAFCTVTLVLARTIRLLFSRAP